MIYLIKYSAKFDANFLVVGLVVAKKLLELQGS